ncbi:unnamed protein product [Cylicocyclus nassatus]|uniref:ShKT domain-containing protein n=1 Tax=Cylicocyclus nassatus TaxID=53992 RepID=A0AA36H6X0_CYLNA|nr:unnamed protein product [Cylicocyclus nassatus]
MYSSWLLFVLCLATAAAEPLRHRRQLACDCATVTPKCSCQPVAQFGLQQNCQCTPAPACPCAEPIKIAQCAPVCQTTCMDSCAQQQQPVALCQQSCSNTCQKTCQPVCMQECAASCQPSQPSCQDSCQPMCQQMLPIYLNPGNPPVPARVNPFVTAGRPPCNQCQPVCQTACAGQQMPACEEQCVQQCQPICEPTPTLVTEPVCAPACQPACEPACVQKIVRVEPQCANQCMPSCEPTCIEKVYNVIAAPSCQPACQPACEPSCVQQALVPVQTQCAPQCMPACEPVCIQKVVAAPSCVPACQPACEPSCIQQVVAAPSCVPSCQPACEPSCIQQQPVVSRQPQCAPQCMPACEPVCIQKVAPSCQPACQPACEPSCIQQVMQPVVVSAPPQCASQCMPACEPVCIQNVVPAAPSCQPACQPACEPACVQQVQKVECAPACQPTCSPTCTQQQPVILNAPIIINLPYETQFSPQCKPACFETCTKQCAQQNQSCVDQGIFCRFVKHFCDEPVHLEVMKRDCAATCHFCEEVVKEHHRNETTITLPNGMRFQQNRSKNNTTTDVPCGGNGARKCILPNEKKLTTTSSLKLGKVKQIPLNDKNRTANSTASSRTITLPKEKTRKSPFATKPNTPSPSNKRMIEYMKNKTRTTADTSTTVIYNVSVVPATESYEARRIKLEELLNSKSNLPNITTADIESFTVSLSKTLIKGKCYDEYTYCREFSSLCADPNYSDVMARHCTLTCNRCNEVEYSEEYGEDCYDITPDCRSHMELCTHAKYRQVMMDSCAKTCKLCTPVCKDRHRNCAKFAEDGFCGDELYSNDERQHLCGQTCKLC